MREKVMSGSDIFANQADGSIITNLKSLGTGKIKYQKKEYEIKIHTLPTLSYDLILGMDWCKATNFFTKQQGEQKISAETNIYSEERKEFLNSDLIKKFFEKQTTIPDHSVRDCTLILENVRKFNPKFKKQLNANELTLVKTHLEELLAAHKIRPSCYEYQ
jgi:uncharacterized protein (UPF0128 family)